MVYFNLTFIINCHFTGCFSYVSEIFLHFAGIRSWDTNLIDCNLDQELKLFVSRHSARFSADAKGKPGRATFVEVIGNPAAQISKLSPPESFSRHRCAPESISEVVALCKGLSVFCNAAASLLKFPFQKQKLFYSVL